MLKNVESLKNGRIPRRVKFKLRDLDVFPNTILSPMDGVTDAPFRRLCRVLSGDRMGLLVSEFVPTDGDAAFRVEGHKQLKFFPEERPFGVQIFGRYPDRMAAAAKKIAEELHPDYIEVNGQKIVNPTEKQLSAAGYLPIEESEPEEREGMTAVPIYSVSSDGAKIMQEWSYEPVPADVPMPEDIDMQ